MKNLSLLFLIISSFSLAQNMQTNEKEQSLDIVQSKLSNSTLQGRVVYEIKMNDSELKINDMPNRPGSKDDLKDILRQYLEKSYVLEFDSDESIYIEEEKLATINPTGIQNTNTYSNDKYYVKLSDNKYIKQIESFGTYYLIIDSLVKPKWEITNETKKIGDYYVIKATFTIPVSDRELENYERIKKNQESSSFKVFEIPEPKANVITAWFTPEIPIGLGPDKYFGLPGLILELHEKLKMYFATEIIMNPKKKVKISEPKKGKVLSQKSYDQMQDEMRGSMRENRSMFIKNRQNQD